VQQAEAAVAAGEAALINNQRQKELQAARIDQALEGIHAAEADITAAQAGVEAAKSAIVNARSAMEASQAEVERTELERAPAGGADCGGIGDAAKSRAGRRIGRKLRLNSLAGMQRSRQHKRSWPAARPI
jgi:hypothetical protein